MSNISNTNSTYTTGGIDTQTTLDGTFDATFQQMNGAASAAIAVETILGDGPTLKGNKADLASRLAEVIDADGKVIGQSTDARTNTVANAAAFSAVTSSAPAVGIGSAILLRAESTDENPSDIVQLGASFDDVGVGTEDSRFFVALRIAGAALTRVFEWVTTTAFKAIFTHANTADRTYTFPNRSVTLESANEYIGPTSVGAGSQHAHEGSVTIAASQALSGIHYYTDFTLNVGQTLTLDDNSGHLCIVATGTITINGTIDGVGAGQIGGSGSTTLGVIATGGAGLSQPGGGGGGSSVGGGNAGGGVVGIRQGGQGGDINTNGTAATQVTTPYFGHYGILGGGGSGGAGAFQAANTGGSGGRAGASISLIAPNIVLGASSTINTSGANGGNAGAGNAGGGGGGGAGNIYIACQSYTNNGCTFTLTGGSGGTGAGTGGNGGAGAAGLRQINIYPS